MTSMEMVCVTIYITSLMKILTSNKMMGILMSMELIMVSIYFSLMVKFMLWFSLSMITIVYLTFMVIESVMGLSAYISITRKSGKDSLSTNSFM